MAELQMEFDRLVRIKYGEIVDLAEMERGCASCGSHEHPNRKCDAPHPNPNRVTGLKAWLEATDG